MNIRPLPVVGWPRLPGLPGALLAAARRDGVPLTLCGRVRERLTGQSVHLHAGSGSGGGGGVASAEVAAVRVHVGRHVLPADVRHMPLAGLLLPGAQPVHLAVQPPPPPSAPSEAHSVACCCASSDDVRRGDLIDSSAVSPGGGLVSGRR